VGACFVLAPVTYPDSCAGHIYFTAWGFDTNSDGVADTLNTGVTNLFARPLPDPSGLFLQSWLGGMTAPMAYYPSTGGYPNAARDLVNRGLNTLIGEGTYEQPHLDSALEFRTRLYSTSGANALKAFYTTAIGAFTPKLLQILQAEEYFRQALRIDPWCEDALNGLLEAYYARAEGFILVANDSMAAAYQHKFDRSAGETKSIVALEIQDIDKALTTYEIGFREFMKLFTTVRFKSPVNRSDYRCCHHEVVMDVEKTPVKWGFSRRA
jgi:hypothetical protein